jgi:hypothetical protein
MRTHFISAGLFALILLRSATFSGAAEAPQDPLWRKAIAISSANSNWVPGLVITRSEVLRKGKPQGTHEMWQRSTLGANGEVITKTVKMVEDGKDVTEKEKPKGKDKGAGKSNGAGGHNPFDPEVQDRLALQLTGRSRLIDGRDCAGYGFELKNPKGPVAKGLAWLEKETGTPVEIEKMTLDPLPDKHLKRLAITTRYETGTNGVWHARKAEMDSTVSVMFMELELRTTTTFEEFWRKPPRETTAGKSETPRTIDK